MTPEERQRQMDFILDTQAQFTANIQQLQEAQTRGEQRTGRLERVVKLMVRAGLRARRDAGDQDARITTLVDSQIRTEEISRRNSEDIAALVTTTESNSQSISALAEIVRQMATRHNGNGGGQQPPQQ
jgi:hypothetical protein